MNKFTATFERFTLELTEEQYLSGSHPGPCDDNIAELLRLDEIKAQFETIKPESIRDELKEYGAWDDEELQDDQQNQARILWIACGNIREDVYEMERESMNAND